MIKRKFIRKVLVTSSVLFAFLLMCILPKRDTLKVKQELTYIENDVLKTNVYLLDSYQYLGKTSVIVNSEKPEQQAKEALEALIKGKAESKLPSGFQAIIPQDTTIKSIKLKDKTIKVDFSKEILEVDKKNEEKMVEAIVYTLTSIDGIENVILYVEGKIITKLPKTGIILPSTLNRSFGINKEYDINTYKDIQTVTVYYLSKYNDEEYYVPVTKYTNSNKSKADIIIESLTTGLTKPNLMSYLNYDTKLLNVENQKDTYILTFNESIFENQMTKQITEPVLQAISFSMADTYQAKEVLFQYGKQEICKTVIKTLE